MCTARRYVLGKGGVHLSGGNKMQKQASGVWGWLLLLAVVVAWDVVALRTEKVDTLSGAFYKALQSPVRRWPTVLVWAVLTMHLFQWPKFLKRLDPFQFLERIAQGK